MGVDHRDTVGMPDVIPMKGLSQIHSEAVNVELLNQRGGAADEHIPNRFFPKPGQPACRSIIAITGTKGSPLITRIQMAAISRAVSVSTRPGMSISIITCLERPPKVLTGRR